MNEIFSVNKPIGKTPYQMVSALRQTHPECGTIPIGYAGRLDPMAHGVLLLLAGDACKQQNEYQRLDKEYEFEVLFGLSTDTYDILGMLDQDAPNEYSPDLEEKVLAGIKKYEGNIQQKLPPYSSYIIDGKPLVVWAREGRLSEITIPSLSVTIHRIEHVKTRQIVSSELCSLVHDNIMKVEGDFRQRETLAKWDEVLKKDFSYIVMTFRAHVSSSTYIRSLVHELGQELGVGAIALDIYRTRVGSYAIDAAEQL